MKVAVATDGMQVATHFGRCEKYVIAELGDGATIREQTMAHPGHEPGRLPQMLHELGVDTIVAGGMGPRAEMFFEQFGIAVMVGISGPVAEALRQLATGNLKAGDSTCEH